MKIKYCPVKWNPYAETQYPEGTKSDSEIEITNDNTLTVDGEEYEFDDESAEYPDINDQTAGVITEAHREGGELFVTVRRFYTEVCDWDTGEYQ